MDFYGFDNQNPKAPGQRFACHWWQIAAAVAYSEINSILNYYNNPAEDIAHINAGAQERIAAANNQTLAEISNIRSEAIVGQAELRSQGILETANLQYQQVKDQMQLMSLADGYEHTNWRFQLRNDVKSLTLAASARLHANQLASVRNKTAMHYEQAARQVEGA
ncbi:MAG: hypothetical protein HYY44_09305 [Deltaproteobacteria bacterium]|nr:hypothetical protein [Deltaproteobacteria bacterium]MBI4374717.1 hypothetical protein [Deltaproteobacteria bacterium]